MIFEGDSSSTSLNQQILGQAKRCTRTGREKQNRCKQKRTGGIN